MSESTFMKTVLFGGYDCASVEQTFERLRGELFRLQNELTEHQKLISYLQQGGNETLALKQMIEEHRVNLTKVQTERAFYHEKLCASERQNNEKDQEIKKLKDKIASLKDRLHEKDMKLSAFEADEDNKRARAAISEIEEKAHSILHNAHKEADQLAENSRKLAENVIANANNTAKKIVYEAEKNGAQIIMEAQNRQADIEIASCNLRAALLADVERLSAHIYPMQKFFEQFQRDGAHAVTNAVKVLSTTDQILKIGGTPIYKAPVTEQVKLPEPPEYAELPHSFEENDEEEAEEQALSEQPEAAQTEQPQPETQPRSELERLQQMANALAGIPNQAPSVQPTTTCEPNVSKEKNAVPDLAALAAQADAIANGNLSY